MTAQSARIDPAALDDNIVVIKVPGAETDAADLLDQEFDPPAVIIPDVLVEGATLLAAKPKIGKTWFALNVLLAGANGSAFFGHRLPRGEALMIALEDNPRRLQSRLRKMVAALGMPERGTLHIRHDWKRGIEGAHFLEGYLDANPAIKLVAIDTWRKIAPARGRHGDLVAEDYSTIVTYNEVADRRHVAVIIVMHLKKGQNDEDWIDGVSGTHGFTAAAGTIMSLRRARGEDTATLSVTGRDLERDSELGLQFNRAHGVWELVGTAAEVNAREERREVLHVLRLNRGAAMTRREIDEAVEKIHGRKRSRTALDKLINGMLDAGQIVAVAGGGYGLPPDYSTVRG